MRPTRRPAPRRRPFPRKPTMSEPPEFIEPDEATPGDAATATETPPDPVEQPGLVERPTDQGPLQRIIDDIVVGRPWFVTLLSIVLALVVGAILIVVSDQEVLSKYGYF